MQDDRSYQRKHLRAPYREPALYVAEDFVFKAHTMNISEGGMLLDQIPHFPEGSEVPLMLSLPQYPYFKNFNLSKLEGFNHDLFPKKVVRLKCRVVRKMGIKSKVDEVFMSRIGVQFTEITPQVQKQIADYVNVFSSNLIYLQVLIDSLHADSQNLAKIRALSSILSYDVEMKIAQLRKDVMHDYKSLQWL
jgi:hypothetical protein